jgi:hypothetical protein
MKWFMSYVKTVYHNGLPVETCFGSAVYDGSGEHPVAKVKRWNETPAFRGTVTVLLSFQEVSYSTPDMDVETKVVAGD